MNIPKILGIEEEKYVQLKSEGVFNKTAIRNMEIRCEYQALRDEKHDPGECIDILSKKYPYISWSTIQKIVYNPTKIEMRRVGSRD